MTESTARNRVSQIRLFTLFTQFTGAAPKQLFGQVYFTWSTSPAHITVKPERPVLTQWLDSPEAEMSSHEGRKRPLLSSDSDRF